MKILLIYPYGKNGWTPPLGILYLASILKKNNHKIKIIDAAVNRLSSDEVVAQARDFIPDIVGISCLTSQVNETMQISRKIKSFSSVPIVVGGSHPSAASELLLQDCPEIDIVVLGEGEVTFSQLINNKTDLSKIDGIAYREKNTIRKNTPREFIEDIDSIPFPAHELNLPLERYASFPELPVMSSRGCPFQCVFCSNAVWSSRKVRERNPSSVIHEIEWLYKDYGVTSVFFYSDTFNLNRAFVDNFCKEFIRKGLSRKVRWRVECRVNERLVDRDMFKLMKEAGCYKVGFGIESGSQTILDNILKGIKIYEIERAIRLARDAGIQTQGYFMVGNYGDTKETVFKTISFAKKLRLDQYQFTILTPYPGSTYYTIAKERGFIVNFDFSNYDEDSPNVRTEKLTSVELALLRDLALFINGKFKEKEKDITVKSLKDLVLWIKQKSNLKFKVFIKSLIKNKLKFLKVLFQYQLFLLSRKKNSLITK